MQDELRRQTQALLRKAAHWSAGHNNTVTGITQAAESLPVVRAAREAIGALGLHGNVDDGPDACRMAADSLDPPYAPPPAATPLDGLTVNEAVARWPWVGALRLRGTPPRLA